MRSIVARALHRSTGRAIFGQQVRRQFSYNRVKDFLVNAWKDTYPDEQDSKIKAQHKFAENKKLAAEDRAQREKYENMTEEELADVGCSLH
jgi:hypothetical protein